MASQKIAVEKVFNNYWMITCALDEVGKFHIGDDIKDHLRKLCNKIHELDITGKEKINFIIKSLHEDALCELKALPQYNINQDNFDWHYKNLEKLYAEQDSEVFAYSKLFNLKQIQGQSLREFISKIRIMGYKIFGNIDPDKREALFVKCLVKGLQNRLQATIIQEMQPGSLEKAYEILKNDNNINKSSKSEDIACYKIEETSDVILDKLNEVCTRLAKLEKQLQASSKTQFKPYEKKHDYIDKKCFNCNMPGHMARNCRRPPTCRNCFKKGHISENCLHKNTKVRHMREDDNDSMVSVKTDDIKESCDELLIDKRNGENEFGGVYMIDKHSSSMDGRNTWRKVSHKKKKCKKEPEEINHWLGYINGKAKKPKTVISISNPERARNKPIIRAKVNGADKNILLDTGCENNVIDYGFLKKISKGNSVNFLQKQGRLKCANGSPLPILGYTVLPVKLGDHVSEMKFTVVEEIFPNVIIGLKYMKRLGITILTGEDAVKIHNTTIPFISKTESVENTKALGK